MSNSPDRSAPMGQNRCELTDLVLAHFLDGALDDLTVTEAEELAVHREECDVCREALARARRLDALLAASVDEHAATRRLNERFGSLLEQALTVEHEPTAATTATRWKSLARNALRAAALVMVGFVVSRWWSSRVEAPTPVPSPEAPSVVARGVPQPAVVSEPAAPSTAESAALAERDRALIAGLSPAFELAELPRRRASRRRPTAEQRLSVLESALSSPWLPVIASALRAVHPAVGDLRASFAERFVAECSSSAAWERASGLLAAPTTRSDLAIQLAHSLSHADGYVAHLRTQLRRGELAAVRPAARLRTARIDQDLFEFARRAVVSSDAVIAAVRESGSRRGRAFLLSRLVEHTVARGTDSDEIALFARVFGGLDPTDTAELLDGLDRSRSVLERRSYLLALGSLGHAEAATALLRLLNGPRTDEAELAAWALGRLPCGCEEFDAVRLDVRRRALLFASRSSRGEPQMRSLVTGLILSPEEADFLREGGFRPQQIAIAARLFRRLAASGD